MENSSTTDTVTTVESLKEIARKFCEDREWDQFHSPKDLAIGAVTESAELLELFRFKSAEETYHQMTRPDFRAKVAQELADILFFVLRFSQKNHVDLTSAFQEKMKNNAAKYPVERFRGRNNKYNEEV